MLSRRKEIQKMANMFYVCTLVLLALIYIRMGDKHD